MSNDGFLTPSPYYFSNDNFSGDWLQVSVTDGVDPITLVIQPKEGCLFPKTPPNKLKAAFANLLESHTVIESLRLTRQGKIFLTTKSTELAQKVLGLSHLLDTPVSTIFQIDSITSRFLLRGIDLEIDCREIASELYEQNILVYEARRFMKKTNDSLLPTTSVLITIFGTNLPKNVNLFYQVYRIQPFYDRPRRCLNCNKFTHSTKSCTLPKTCVRCSEPSHEGACTTETKCSNCHGPHDASDVTCPVYAQEVKIQEFKTNNHLSIGEARRQFSLLSNSHTKTYASAASAELPHPSLNKIEDFVISVAKELANQFMKAFDYQNQLIQSLSNQLQAIGNLIPQASFPSPPQSTGSSVLEPTAQSPAPGGSAQLSTPADSVNSLPLSSTSPTVDPQLDLKLFFDECRKKNKEEMDKFFASVKPFDFKSNLKRPRLSSTTSKDDSISMDLDNPPNTPSTANNNKSTRKHLPKT